MTTTDDDGLGISAIEQLLAIEDIKKVFAGRLRCMDTKDWDRYASFHTDDVVSDSWQATDATGPSTVPRDQDAPGRVRGNLALAQAIRNTLDGRRTIISVHHGHTPEIELTSPTTARGVWAMEDLLTFTEDGAQEWLHGYGHYHEEYRKVDGRWLISYRALTRLKVDQSTGFNPKV